MPKKWSDVAASSAFQALSLEEKEEARRQYFDEVIAPLVPEEDFDLARRQFDQDTSLVRSETATDPRASETTARPRESARRELPEGVTPSDAGGGRGFVNPPMAQARDDRSVIQRVADFLKPEKKSVMEGYKSSPQEQQKDIDRRLSYGSGPISQKTVEAADLVRRGEATTDNPIVRQVAEGMDRAKVPTFEGLVKRTQTKAVQDAARNWTAEEFRAPGEWAVDTLSSVGQSAVGLLQIPVNIIAPSSDVAERLRKTQEDLQAAESDVLRAQREQLKERVLGEEGFFGKYFGTVYQLAISPALSLSEGVKQVPNFLAVVGLARAGGALAAGGVSAAAKASPTVALGEAISGGALQSAARVAGTTAGGAGATMVMAAGDAAGQVYETLTSSDPQVRAAWQKNPDYIALRDKKIEEGLDRKEAARQAIEELATTKARMAALITAPLGLLGYAGAEAAIATRGVSKAAADALTVRGMAKTATKDLIGEQAEEGGTQFGANVLTRTVDPNQSLTSGVPEAMGTALVTSAPFTAAAIRSQYKDAQKPQVFDAAADRVANRLLDPNVYDPSLMDPADALRKPTDVGPSAPPMNFTPADSPSAQAGLAPIVVPTTAAPVGSPLNVGGVNVGSESVLGGSPADGGSPLGTQPLGGMGSTGSGVDVTAGSRDPGAGIAGTSGGATAVIGAGTGERTAGLTLPRLQARATDAELLSRVDAALPRAENNNAVVEPTQVWFGRRGDGYATRTDADQALPGRQRMFPELQWKLEPMPNGKFRLAGYPQEINLGTQTPQAQQTEAQGIQAQGVPAASATVAQPAVGPGSALELSDSERSGLKLALPAPTPTISALRTQLKRARGVDVDVIPASDLTDSQRLASAVGRLMGKTVTVVRAVGGKADALPNGFINSLGGKHLFVAENADDAPLSIALHEGYHGIPEARRKVLNAALLQTFNQDLRGEFNQEFGYDDANFEEEAPAMMAQVISKRADFWEELRTKMGNKEFGEVAKVILSKLTQIVTGAKEQYGDAFVGKYIKDVERARNLLSDAYAESMRAQGLKADDIAVEPQMSNRAVRSPLGFYSELENKVGDGPNQAKSDQWKAYVKGLAAKGVKQDEIEWSGLNDWLDMQSGKVSKDQVAEYLRSGGVKVQEVVLGDNKVTAEPINDEVWERVRDEPFARKMGWYEEDSYLIRINGKPAGVAYGQTEDEAIRVFKEDYSVGDMDYAGPQRDASGTKYSQYTLPGGENYREVLLKLPSKADLAPDEDGFADAREEAKDYRSSHWDQRNVLAHIRMNDRTDSDGKKVLFVEEVQSDWGQEGKKKGFAPRKLEQKLSAQEYARALALQNKSGRSDAEQRELDELLARHSRSIPKGGLTPAAPFVTKTEGWLNLALKRVITMAAEGGYDRVAFTTGEQNAQRFGLSKRVGAVYYSTDGVGRGTLVAMPVGKTINDSARPVFEKDDVPPSEVGEYIGEDLAKKLLASPVVDGFHSVVGGDMRVGGEGMKAFYDQILPLALKKLLPKVGGGSITSMRVSGGGEQVGFDITPAMRERVKTDGVPMFSERARRSERAEEPERPSDQSESPLPVTKEESIVDNVRFSSRARNLVDIPTLELRDLIGKKVFGIKADLTDAGRSYTGIDGSQLGFPIEMMGGPNYVRLPENIQSNVVWAVRGGGTLKKILNQVGKSDYVLVHAMGDDSHLTNSTVSTAYLQTVEAYLRDGRIGIDNLRALDRIVRSPDNKSALSDFPGFESPEIYSYIDSLSFDQRGALAKILAKKEAQEHGLPNLDRFRRETLDPDFVGYRQGDAMLVIKVDKDRPTVRLGEEGTKLHPSYPLGLRGKVIGKLAKGVNYKLIFRDYFEKTVPTFKNKEDGAWYGFDRSMPIQVITNEIADSVAPGGYRSIKTARQAEAALAMANGSWLVSGRTKAQGGVSVQEFVDALRANDGVSALTLYSAAEIKAGIKAKKFTVYQLGTQGGDKGLQVFFGLKRGAPWYKGMVDGVSDNEVEVVSVTNNEPGAPGVGIPAIITKAISEGATVLDCFAVKSPRFPEGFLPEMYSQFGFEQIGRIKFDPTFYDDIQLKDLKAFWSKGGWKESDGYPDVVVMRWRGRDEDRAGAVERYVRSGATGVPGQSVGDVRAAAAESREQRDGPRSETRGARSTDSRPSRGDQGAGDAASVVRRAYGSIQELAELSDGDVRNLGLDPKEVQRLRDRLSGSAQFSNRVRSETIDVDGAIRPTRNSEGRRIADTEEDVRNFWRWFGDSKVVDAAGRPIVVYHGTASDITTFDAATRGVNTEVRSARLAFFFASSSNVAEGYAKLAPSGNQILYDRLSKLLEQTSDPAARAIIEQRLGVIGKRGQEDSILFSDTGITGGANVIPVYLRLVDPIESDYKGNDYRERSYASVLRSAQEEGHDGAIFRNTDDSMHKEHVEKTDVFAVFEPGQIKSAIGNVGAYGQRRISAEESARLGLSEEAANAAQARGDMRFSNRSQPVQGQIYTLKGESGFQQKRRIIQDYFLRAREVQQAVAAQGGTVGEAQDIYLAEELSYGRLQAQLEDFKDKIVRPLVKDVRKAGLQLSDLALYAYAKHAPERNAEMQAINPTLPAGTGSGMTDQEAADIIDAYRREGKLQKLDALHQRLKGIIEATRMVLWDEGLITQAQFDAWQNQYQDYIPLRGFVEDEEDTVTGDRTRYPKIRGGKGFNVRGDESVRALGRTSRAGHIIENIIGDYERAIARAERNNVAKVLLDFVTTNPDPDLWEIDATRTTRSIDRKTGLVQYNTLIDKGDDTVSVKVGGEEVYIKIKDPLLLRAMRQASKDETGEVTRFLVKTIGWYGNLMRNTLTRFNPAFGAVNAVKDFGFATTSVLAELGPKGAALFMRHYANPIQSGRMYDEFRASGAITGGWHMRDAKEMQKELQRVITWEGGGTLKSGAYKAGVGLLDTLEWVGQYSETQARFAAYKAAREMGLSPARAASLAKNVSTNFNRKGEWGAALNTAYVFFGAGVQGTAQYLRNLKSPWVQGTMAGLTGLSFGLAVMGAGIGGDDDDGETYWDKIPAHEKERNLIIMLPPGDPLIGKGYARVGSRGRYMKIPVQYGLNVFSTLGYQISDVLRNSQDSAKGMTLGKAAIQMTSVMAGAFNPVGGSFDPTKPVEVGLAASPSVIDVAIQFMAGVDGFGKPTSPTKSSNDGRPDSENYRPDMAGSWEQRLARWLNTTTGGDAAVGGAIDLSPGTIRNVARNLTGGAGDFISSVFVNVPSKLMDPVGDIKASDVPILKAFYGEADERTDLSKYYERRAEIMKAAEEAGRRAKLGIRFTYDEDSKGLQAMGKVASEYGEAMTNLRRRQIEIAEDQSLSKSDRTQKLMDVQREIVEFARDFNAQYVGMKKDVKAGNFRADAITEYVPDEKVKFFNREMRSEKRQRLRDNKAKLED